MEFRLLGSLEVVEDGRPVDLPPGAPRAVVGMLLTRPNEVVSADRLAEGLWGADLPATAPNILQGYVSRLRKVLGAGRVQTRPPGYMLTMEAEGIDAVRFARLLDEGRQARAQGDPQRAANVLAQALALWRSEPLADFTYAEWAQAEIARLAELRLTAVEESIEVRLDLGHHSQVLAELDGLVVHHPLRERLWAARILALYRAGRQADALRAYQELRTQLGEELGIDPSSQLVALEGAVLRQDASLTWRPPAGSSRLPVMRSSFVGRDQDLRELEKLVQETGLVTVVGAGGIGKTRLAVEVARRLSGAYKDVRLVELGPLSDPSLLVQQVAGACSVREEPGHALTETLAAALASRRLLLVLDNCEHVLDATASLADALLRAAPELAILATSRQPLRIGGERVWHTPTLPVPPDAATSPEAALDFDAVRLFCDRACDADERFTVNVHNVAAVAEICRRLDGIPLALELAAARISALTPAQIAVRLSDRFRLLRGGSRAAPERQQTLAAAVQWSYDLCSSSEQALFRRLSVFAGGFTLEAAETVCADDALPREEVLDLLSALVDRSLVVVQHQGDNLRYQMLETIRAYAEERLVDAGDDRAAGDADVSWAASFAESMAQDLAPQVVTLRGTLERFDLEHDNVRRALEWAAPVDSDAVLRIVAATLPFWNMRGHIEEIRRWSEFVLTSAANGPPALRARVLQGAGGQALAQGHSERGRILLEEAGAVFRELGDERSIAYMLGALIQSAMDQDRDYEVAERLAHERVAIYLQEGDLHLSSEALSTLALVAIERGNEVMAQDLIERALHYNHEHADDPCPTVWNAAGRVA